MGGGDASLHGQRQAAIHHSAGPEGPRESGREGAAGRHGGEPVNKCPHSPSSSPLLSAGAAQGPSPATSHRTKEPNGAVLRDWPPWAQNGRGKNGEDNQPSATPWILGDGGIFFWQPGAPWPLPHLPSSPHRFSSLGQSRCS